MLHETSLIICRVMATFDIMRLWTRHHMSTFSTSMLLTSLNEALVIIFIYHNDISTKNWIIVDFRRLCLIEKQKWPIFCQVFESFLQSSLQWWTFVCCWILFLLQKLEMWHFPFWNEFLLYYKFWWHQLEVKLFVSTHTAAHCLTLSASVTIKLACRYHL